MRYVSGRSARFRLLLCTASAFALAGAVHAQTSVPAATTDATQAPAPVAEPVTTSAAANVAPSGSTGAIGDIVVTAERRSANLQKTPVAVTVLQGGDLRDRGRFTLTQILEDVPGTVINSIGPNTATSSDSPANLITIRGVQSNQAIPGNPAATVASTAYYVDGVLNGIGGDYDLSNVQVLRGPQGTLYGRSSTAGAVIVTTANPQLGKVTGDAIAEFGDYDLRHFSGAINLPLANTLALRVSGDHYERDGYYVPTNTGIDNNQARAKLLFQPSDSFSALAGFAYQHLTTSNGGRSGTVDRTRVAADNVVYDNVDPVGHVHSRTLEAWGQFDLKLGELKLTYIPTYKDYQQNGNSYAAPLVIPGLGTFVSLDSVKVNKNNTLTQELRLASDAQHAFTWQTGVFYYNNDLVIHSQALNPYNNPFGVVNSAQPLVKNTKNVGVFAEGTYTFPSRTHVTLGIRYDYTKVNANELSCFGGDVNVVPCGLGLPGATFFAEKRTFNNVTYKARITQDFGSNGLVYASVSSGFLPGDVAVITGIDGNGNSTPQPGDYNSERLTSYEIGFKNRFFDNHLQINADVFYYDFSSHDVSVELGMTNQNLLALKTEGSPVRMKGAELEALLRLTKADRFTLSLSYVDAKYHNKPADLNILNDKLGGVVPWQVTPGYTHTFSLPGNRELSFNVYAIYRSGYLVNDVSPASAQGFGYAFLRNTSTWNLNLNATLNLTKSLTVSAYVRNLTNDPYKLYARPILAGPGGFIKGSIASLSEPRTFGGLISFRF